MKHTLLFIALIISGTTFGQNGTRIPVPNHSGIYYEWQKKHTFEPNINSMTIHDEIVLLRADIHSNITSASAPGSVTQVIEGNAMDNTLAIMDEMNSLLPANATLQDVVNNGNSLDNASGNVNYITSTDGTNDVRYDANGFSIIPTSGASGQLGVSVISGVPTLKFRTYTTGSLINVVPDNNTGTITVKWPISSGTIMVNNQAQNVGATLTAATSYTVTYANVGFTPKLVYIMAQTDFTGSSLLGYHIDVASISSTQFTITFAAPVTGAIQFSYQLF